MHKTAFKNMQFCYETEMDHIQDRIICKIYSNINFHFLSFENVSQENDIQLKDIKNLMNHLINFKFFTYELRSQSIDSKQIPNIIDVTICREGECFIIKKIKNQLFDEIINNLKDQQINILNVKLNEQINEEVNQFCSKFTKEILNNKFVEITIRSIACFLIRRYFYPTEIFKDPSFFYIDPINDSKEQQIKSKLADFFFSNSDEKKLQTIFDEAKEYEENKCKMKLKEFQISDFIILRTIFSNEIAFFYLVIHIETLYIFMMKKLKFPERKLKEVEHEKHFCKNFSHRCILNFYGFMKEKGKIAGFIYEYMTNGTLNDYIKANENQINNNSFLLMSIDRIFQGINYSNSLINRDLKPSNILLDHNNLPYISDLETIRPILDSDMHSSSEMTNGISTPLYSSPEQDLGLNASFSSDIYSLSLVIYYLYEKEDLLFNNISRKYGKSIYNVNLTNAPKNIELLFKKCFKYSPKERATNQEINNIIINEFNSFDCIEQYIRTKTTVHMDIGIIHFLYEYILLSLNDFKQFFQNVVLFRNLISMINDELCEKIYENDSFDETLYSKAIKYLNILAKQNNLSALLNLGNLYEKGLGVQKNYMKARECYELTKNKFTSTLSISRILLLWK